MSHMPFGIGAKSAWTRLASVFGCPCRGAHRAGGAHGLLLHPGECRRRARCRVGWEGPAHVMPFKGGDIEGDSEQVILDFRKSGVHGDVASCEEKASARGASATDLCDLSRVRM